MRGVPENEIKICMIDLSRNSLDNDYTFYESGLIHRFYDRNNWALNNEEILNPNQIDQAVKDQLIAKCPPDKMEKIKQILGV